MQMRVPASVGEASSSQEAAVSAVSWAAIIAGAFATVAMALMLLALGSGIGLASASPWPNAGASATSFTVAAAIWLIVVQWVSSGFGGYLTGRLRTKWANLHGDEVFFRDTAHGFLAWCVAAVVTVLFLASAASSVLGGATHAVGAVASGAASGASQGAAQAGNSSADPTAYFTDRLFRSDRPAQNASDQEVRAEAVRVLAMGARSGSVADADKSYLAQLVSARTGLSNEDAAKRVDDVVGQAQAAETKLRQAADQARKAASELSFYTFFSMLIGAFIASVAAALGGRQRDEF